MNKNKVKYIIIGLLIFIIAFGIYKIKSSIDGMYMPVDVNDNKEYEITIPKGSSASTVATILYDNKIVNNGSAFKDVLQSMGKEGDIVPGVFKLKKSMTLEEIVNAITASKSNNKNTIKVTIPEGFELKQIAKRLNDKNICSEDDFIKASKDMKFFEEKFSFLDSLSSNKNLEGFLFPATYEFSEKEDPYKVISTMLETFELRFSKLADLNDVDLNKIITLASIVEREAKLDDERPIIARVFLNRINKKMKLQSCATVQYALGERKTKLTNEDLKVDSPYNTYTHEGLPPAPISNPGEESIKASLNPAEVDYLFFVVDPSKEGGHHFAKTYEEFLKYKKEYKNNND